MNKIKLNIQLFAGSVSIGTITETTDIDTNQSTFTIPATMTTSGSTYNNDDAYMTLQWRYSGGSSWTTISKKTFGISTNSNKTKSWTLSLTHEDDGTLTDVQFRVQWYITSSTNGTTSTKTYSPITIPRASEIDSITDGTTPYYPTIKWTPNSNTFKYKVKYTNSRGTNSVTSSLITPNQTTPYTFSNTLQIPDEFFVNVDSSTQTATATLYTYKSDGTSLIGEKTKSFSITLNTDIKGTISISNLAEADETMQNLDWGVYVKGKSKLSYKVNYYFSIPTPASAKISASTNNQSFSEDAIINISTKTKTFTTNFLNTSGTNTITASITDSRGRTTNAIDQTYSVVDYTNPTISIAQVERCDANGNVTPEGTHIKISYGASISSCNGLNTSHSIYKVGYRIHNTGNYEYVEIHRFGDSANESGILFTNGIKSASSTGTKVEISSDYTYDIQFYVEDAFTESTIVQVLDTGFDLMNFNQNGKAMAIGKVSEATGDNKLLEIALPTYATEKIETTKSIRIPKNSTAGYGLCNSDGTSILRDYNNTHVTVNATGGTLFLGHQTTTGIDFLNGKGTMDSSGNMAINGQLTDNGGSRVRTFSGGAGTSGWMKIASLEITQTYMNQFIIFEIAQRSRTGIVLLKFNGGNTTDPSIAELSVIGDTRVYLYKTSTSNWDMYIEKSEAHDNIEVVRYHKGTYSVGVNLTWNGTGTTVTTANLPTGGTYSWIEYLQMHSLYSNSTGATSGTINLSANASNYQYIEIFYYYEDSQAYSSIKINSPNGKKALLEGCYDNGTYLYKVTDIWTISGTSLSKTSGTRWRFATSGNPTRTSGTTLNDIYIYKVVGYK